MTCEVPGGGRKSAVIGSTRQVSATHNARMTMTQRQLGGKGKRSQIEHGLLMPRPLPTTEAVRLQQRVHGMGDEGDWRGEKERKKAETEDAMR